MSQLEKRSKYTKGKIEELKNELAGAEDLLDGKACVYATGSFGRLEAYDQSDLDLFIVGKAKPLIEEKVLDELFNINLLKSLGEEEIGLRVSALTKNLGMETLIRKSQLSNLRATKIKARLIEATESLNLPPFDVDGKYLTHFSEDDLIKRLGKTDDDEKNTLTSRLLLFLESKPLLGAGAYKEIMGNVIDAYWRDYEDHKNDFTPAFLANDILRLWRTFCVNYEARTKRNPKNKKIDGKIKNYKLGHSRIITCYSALLYLLAIHKMNGTVTPKNALDMTKLTPIERLHWLEGEKISPDSKEKIGNLVSQYDKFLEITSVGKEELAKQFSDKNQSIELGKESKMFGRFIFEAMQSIGDGSDFYRMIVV